MSALHVECIDFVTIPTSFWEPECRGVAFVAGTWDSGVCDSAAFRDPDDSTPILHRRDAPRMPQPR